MTTFFVSDMHLSMARPAIVDDFVGFLQRVPQYAHSLYILGDCFDFYLGDDDQTEPHPRIFAALKTLTEGNTAVSVVRGNHDFLIGNHFETLTGTRVLEDLTVIDLYGTKTLIMHGDTLCTDDVEYQDFRRYSRDPDNQRAFLALPLQARRVEAERLRAKSQDLSRLKTEEIMDVSADAVTQAMREHKVLQLIHGHTHRPACHDVNLEGKTPGRRIVLGDWYDSGSVLACDANGLRRTTLSEF